MDYDNLLCCYKNLRLWRYCSATVQKIVSVKSDAYYPSVSGRCYDR